MTTSTPTTTDLSGPRPPDVGTRFLTFTLNTEAFALDTRHVTEILELGHLTTVPMMPDFVRGVINLRGRVVPVVDLAARFRRGETLIGRRTTVVIVHVAESESAGDAGPAGQDIGVLVDSANKVVTFAANELEPAPAFGAGLRADYISGMARQDDDFVIVLDIDRILLLDDLAPLTTGDATAGRSVPAPADSQ